MYDGHGGRQIADYLEDHLASNVAKEWAASEKEEEKEKKSSMLMKADGGSDDDQKQQSKKRRLDDKNINEHIIDKESQTIQTALERAFLLTDIQSKIDGITTSGATVICCIVIPQFTTNGVLSSIIVHSANAGDARAVLSSTLARASHNSNNNCHPTESSSNNLPNPELPNEGPINKSMAVRLSFDHKSTCPKEIARIENSGGIMIRGRVLGVLAVARSLGDHGLKEYVISRPYLSSTTIRIENNVSGNAIIGKGVSETAASKKAICPAQFPLTQGEFLIVACDGLWDVIEDQEACDLVRSYVNAHGLKKREATANFLIHVALKRGSTDNVTVIVYWL